VDLARHPAAGLVAAVWQRVRLGSCWGRHGVLTARE
jgi:hypothetical protein